MDRFKDVRHYFSDMMFLRFPSSTIAPMPFFGDWNINGGCIFLYIPDCIILQIVDDIKKE